MIPFHNVTHCQHLTPDAMLLDLNVRGGTSAHRLPITLVLPCPDRTTDGHPLLNGPTSRTWHAFPECYDEAAALEALLEMPSFLPRKRATSRARTPRRGMACRS